MTGAAERAFQEALARRDAGDHAQALEILVPLSEALGDSAAFHAVLAHVSWKLKRHAEAVLAFRRSIAIAPTYEKASLGLFHVLWQAGDTDAAFGEMRRFLRLAPSDEYQRLLADIGDGPAGPDDVPGGDE